MRATLILAGILAISAVTYAGQTIKPKQYIPSAKQTGMTTSLCKDGEVTKHPSGIIATRTIADWNAEIAAIDKQLADLTARREVLTDKILAAKAAKDAVATVTATECAAVEAEVKP